MKNQKNSGLFWFFAWIVVTCLLKSVQKPKKTWVFWFFGLLQVRVPSKNKKKTLSFLGFFKVMTKKPKKTWGKPKKNKHEPQTKHSLKSFGFLVLWFYRGFLFLVFRRFSQQNLRSRNVRSVFDIGVAIMFSLFCRHISKNTFHYRPLVSTISLRKRLSPEYVRQFISNSFLWRPDFFSKRSSLLSLKTGLFQREVACKEESSIWTNRLSVKQGFF